MTRNYKVTVNGTTYDVNVEEVDSTSLKTAPVAATPQLVKPEAEAVSTATQEPTVEATEGESTIVAPMPGKILKMMVAKGDLIVSGQPILILEAMKMENEIFASTPGTVTQVLCKEGDSVNTGDTLVVIA